MRYQMFQTESFGPEVVIQVLDMVKCEIIRFTFDELDKNTLPPDLESFIYSIRNDILNGKWEYLGYCH